MQGFGRVISHDRARAGCLLLLAVLLLSCGRDPNQSSGPKIGITYGTYQAVSDFVGFDFLNEAYVASVQRNGGVAVKLSVLDGDEELARKLGAIDGLLIPGGVDVAPERYGQQADETLESTDPRIDALDLRALKYAARNNLPILGICRGLQIINVFKGGTLHQDIAKFHKGPLKTVHRVLDKGIFIDWPDQCAHPIDIDRKSHLFALIDKRSAEVNSLHHQAINRLGEGLQVTARAPDGTIEAIEATEGSFVMGVQFHPEMMIEENPIFNEIFGALVRKAAK